MQQLNVTGQESMFGDNDINFVLQPEKFGVEMGVLKEAEIKHVFGHGWKIVKRTHGRKMAVLLRHSYSPYIKVLFSMILTQGSCFQFGSKICSSARKEKMDGSWLVFVQMMKTTMRPSCWKLHVN